MLSLAAARHWGSIETLFKGITDALGGISTQAAWLSRHITCVSSQWASMAVCDRHGRTQSTRIGHTGALTIELRLSNCAMTPYQDVQ